MDIREWTAAERENFDELGKFDLLKVAYAWCVIALITAFTWCTCDSRDRILGTVHLNVKWLALVFLYAGPR